MRQVNLKRSKKESTTEVVGIAIQFNFKILNYIEKGNQTKFLEIMEDMYRFVFTPAGIWKLQPRINNIFRA